MLKSSQNNLMPLSLAASSGRLPSFVGTLASTKKTQHLNKKCNIVNQGYVKQKSKQNNNNKSVKQLQKQLQKISPVRRNKKCLGFEQRQIEQRVNQKGRELIKNPIMHNKFIQSQRKSNKMAQHVQMPVSAKINATQASQSENLLNKKNSRTKLGKFEKVLKNNQKSKNNTYHKQEPSIQIEVQINDISQQSPIKNAQNLVKEFSIINSLQEQTKFLSSNNSPKKRYKNRQICELEEKASIKKYNSENKLKRYHYLSSNPIKILQSQQETPKKLEKVTQQPIYTLNLISQNKNSYENYRLEKRNQSHTQIQTKRERTNRNISQEAADFINSIDALNYHYYDNPNVAYKPNSHHCKLDSRKSTSKSKSLSKLRNYNVSSMASIMGYPTDLERSKRSRQASLQNIQRIKRKEHQIQIEVKKLGQRCRNMLNSIQSTSYLQGKELSKQTRKKYQYQTQQKQTRKQVNQIENKSRDNFQRSVQRTKYKSSWMQRQQKQLEGKKFSCQQNVDKFIIQKEEFNCASGYSPLRLRQKQYSNRNESKTNKYCYNLDTADKQSQNYGRSTQDYRILVSKPSERKYSHIQCTPKNVGIKQFCLSSHKHNVKIEGEMLKTHTIKEKQICRCKHECECNMANQLNTSRLNRINSKLEHYITANIRKQGSMHNLKSAHCLQGPHQPASSVSSRHYY